MLGMLLPELLKRAGVEAKDVDDYITGCAQGVGEQWTYGGRGPVLLANFPEAVASKFVDQQCGSAMAGSPRRVLDPPRGIFDKRRAIPPVGFFFVDKRLDKEGNGEH